MVSCRFMCTKCQVGETAPPSLYVYKSSSIIIEKCPEFDIFGVKMITFHAISWNFLIPCFQIMSDLGCSKVFYGHLSLHEEKLTKNIYHTNQNPKLSV